MKTYRRYCSMLLTVGCVIASANQVQAQTVPAPTIVEGNTIPKLFKDGAVNRVRLAKPRELTLGIVKPEKPELTDVEKVKYEVELVSWSLSEAAGLVKPNNLKEIPNDPATVTVELGSKALDQELRFRTTAQFDIKKKVATENGDAEELEKIKKKYVLKPPASQSLFIYVDTNEPKVKRVEIERFPGGGGFIQVVLEEDDLDENSIKTRVNPAAFILKQKIKDSNNQAVVGSDRNPVELPVDATGEPTYNAASNTITLDYSYLNPGDYVLTITGLTDKVGNPMPTTPAEDLRIPGGRQRGDHIPYPDYLGPRNEKSSFVQPGHKVETRVARLFYYRDARRVVQIINRNVKNLNQTGVDQAERLASQARDDADDRTQERRETEAKAIRAAQKTRETTAKLDQAEADLDESNRRQTDLKGEKAEVDQLIATPPAPAAGTPAPSDAQLKNLQARLESQITGEETRSRQLTSDISNLRAQLEVDQKVEIETRSKIQPAEAKELRARSEQFRREVAFGLADHDTYAAGKKDSIDPVTQVSMSVIGTGVIQMRGPIRGINKIRRMIHQIDVPVGQVKIGIHTIQINGEHGDRMELAYSRIDKNLAHARFLANHSGMLFRQAVSQVASGIASGVDNGYIPPGCEELCNFEDTQSIRDLKYLYSFFGKDFIGELRRMDSTLLKTDNKFLSLSSMDTLSLHSAMYVAALADHPVRELIVKEFQKLIAEDLPQHEADYYQALTRIRHANPVLNYIATRPLGKFNDKRDRRRIIKNAARTYRFSNTIHFLDSKLCGPGTLNSVQHATIRIAQAMKAQLVSEMELHNLVLERSLLKKTEEDNLNTNAMQALRAREAAERTFQAQMELISSIDALNRATLLALQRIQRDALPRFLQDESKRYKAEAEAADNNSMKQKKAMEKQALIKRYGERVFKILTPQKEQELLPALLVEARRMIAEGKSDEDVAKSLVLFVHVRHVMPAIARPQEFDTLKISILRILVKTKRSLEAEIKKLRTNFEELDAAETKLQIEEAKLALAKMHEKKQFGPVFALRYLEQSIDEKEEQAVELQEAMRSHVANVDSYLKELAIALEDDITAQFYKPAFVRLRMATRLWDVQFGQLETTTILTNNRTFAKVSPEATIEFDLPEREILATEIFDSAKALATEYGALMQDGTFLAASSMLAGTPAGGLVGSQTPLQQLPGLPERDSKKFGAALEALIPDPAVYKFETGTGFEIRPVIQPDGHSIVYDFNYTYTTNVREPVRADEKHLGRVKRHFVHTDVQTSSYELREISRYTVALKASRTARGVPLLEDVPIAGILFRPLPSAESSLQQNIILAASVIYPTMYDIMGLRWSAAADEIDSINLQQKKQEARGRHDRLKTFLLQEARTLVDEQIGIWDVGSEEYWPVQPSENEPPPAPAAETDSNGAFLPPTRRATEPVRFFKSPSLDAVPSQGNTRPRFIDSSLRPANFEQPARTPSWLPARTNGSGNARPSITPRPSKPAKQPRRWLPRLRLPTWKK